MTVVMEVPGRLHRHTTQLETDLVRQQRRGSTEFPARLGEAPPVLASAELQARQSCEVSGYAMGTGLWIDLPFPLRV